MDTPTKTTRTQDVKHLLVSAPLPMALDMVAIDAARQGTAQGLASPKIADEQQHADELRDWLAD